KKSEGTFPLDTVRANTSEAPDVMVALRWNSKPNRFGAAGQIITDNTRGPGEGSHATLSEFDVHNTLVAAGPDFQKSLTTSLPSANVDIAPTVLRILGLEPPQKLDGRVLAEAMDERAGKTEALTKTIQASRKFPSGERIRVALSTQSRKNAAAGFDPRMRIGLIASTWRELPATGLSKSSCLDYQSLEAATTVAYVEYGRPEMELLLTDKTKRAIFIEAWGELYIRVDVGIHQAHSMRASR